MAVAHGPDGRPAVNALLDELGRRRRTNVLVEGGGEVLGSFVDADAADEVHIFVAPLLIGGAGAPAPLAGRGVAHLQDALRLTDLSTVLLDGDVYLHGRKA